MKVLNILDEDRFGGPQKRVLMISRELKKLGISNKVLFPATCDLVFEKSLADNDIDFVRVKFSKLENSIAGWTNYILTFASDIARIRKVIVEACVDLVHINNVRNIKPIIACLLTKCRFCWHVTDSKTDVLSLYIFKFFSRLSPSVIYSSNAARCYYSKFNSVNENSVVDVIPSCIYLEPRRERKEPCGDLTILMVGNISPVKGYERVVEFARTLKSRNVQCKFVIVGSRLKTQDKYMQELERAITQGGVQNFFEFKGFRDPADFYRTSDYFLCVSTSESSPLAVWEAANNELPIISTDVGDVKHILQDAVRVISGDSPEEFLCALTQLRDDEVRDETVKRAKYLIKQLCVMEIATKTKNVYERILR